MPLALNRTSALRVVIDTNAVLDWLVFANPAAAQLGDSVRQGHSIWCATAAMLDELRMVLNRPLAERWEPARKLALTSGLDSLAFTLPPKDIPAPPDRLICRDPADQMFIDLALRCSPSWLVTRDRALLALRRRAAPKGVVIATPEQWQQHHASVAAASAPAPP